MKNPDLWLIFSHKGKEYPVFIPEDKTLFRDDELMGGGWSIFWWDEGNGGCDCNRSREIAKHFPRFPILGCGSEIELADYEIVENGKDEMDEAIERYDKPKRDGTLDRDFPRII